MNDDNALMPPPPPRGFKRHKTLAPLNDEKAILTSQQHQGAPVPVMFDNDSALISVGPRHNCRSDGGGLNYERETYNYACTSKSSSGYSLMNSVRLGAVSPEEYCAFIPESANNSMLHNESPTHYDSQGKEKSILSYDDCLIVSKSDDSIIVSNNNQVSRNVPFESNGKAKLHQKVCDIGSNRDSYYYRSTKRKQTQICDSHTLVNVSFRDIIGHGQAKLRLDEALLPLALPRDLADSVLTGIRAAPASILLHGPPGCGKTKLAKAVAGEAQAAFFSVGPSDILSKFVGESEASIRGLFQEARRRAKNSESKCAVILFDEVDALGRSRVDEESGKMSQAGADNSSRRVLAELLIQMTNLNDNQDGENGTESEGEEYDGYCDDGESFSGRSNTSTSIADRTDDGMQPSVDPCLRPKALCYEEHHVGTHSSSGREGSTTNSSDQMQPKPRIIVIAATNRPEDCDPALLRRFAVRVLVGLPSKKDRKKIIQRLLLDVEHNIVSSQLDELAHATEGWSGSDLESMTREAVMAPVRESLRAAAIMKRKASKVVQRSGVDSSQMQELKRVEDARNATREALLNQFRKLRPVSARDFEDGIAFFLGDQRGSSVSGPFQDNYKQRHYDSSSSSEDDE